jgi:hypothetical protein
VLALCLPDPLRGVAGMDLFSADPDGAATIDVFHVPFPDALGLLRAHATDRTADDLAADLVARPIDPEELREDADSDR